MLTTPRCPVIHLHSIARPQAEARAVDTYTTKGGLTVLRTVEELPLPDAIEPLIGALDDQRGVLLASGYDYPGRYTRWDIGFVNPPLALTCRDRDFRLTALNERGRLLLPALTAVVANLPEVAGYEHGVDSITGAMGEPAARFPEEQRSRQPSIFSLLRAVIRLFASPADAHLGLYGAFGYDLAFQFEPMKLYLARPESQRDLVLYLPDELVVVDHQRERAQRLRYDFEADGVATAGLPREGARVAYRGAPAVERDCDHGPGEYAAVVRQARDYFKRGDLFVRYA